MDKKKVRAAWGFGWMVTLIVLTVSAFPANSLADQAETGGGGERFWANLVDPNARMGARTAPVVIRIEEYSSDAEIQQLAATLRKGEPDKLRKALWNVEKGYIRVDGGLGYPIALAHSRPTENGRRIVLLIDRPVPSSSGSSGTIPIRRTTRFPSSRSISTKRAKVRAS